MDLKFRPISKSDHNFMVQMLYEATIASEQTFDVTDVQSYPHSFAYVQDFPRTGELGIIAELNDSTPVGAAWLRNFPNDDKPGISGPELTIAISPSYRRQGLAKCIMTYLYAAARQENIKIIKLGVYHKNVPALEFYKNDGWESDVVFGDYLMMKRSL
ncbi:TPA: GNAT family N-acetyltransferase [Serratia liquefaciens]|nr:GNAT family N-acetyltransferase [Serratia liquefaciens]